VTDSLQAAARNAIAARLAKEMTRPKPVPTFKNASKDGRKENRHGRGKDNREGRANANDREGSANADDREGGANADDREGGANADDREGSANADDRDAGTNADGREGKANADDREGNVQDKYGDTEGEVNAEDGDRNAKDVQPAKGRSTKMFDPDHDLLPAVRTRKGTIKANYTPKPAGRGKPKEVPSVVADTDLGILKRRSKRALDDKDSRGDRSNKRPKVNDKSQAEPKRRGRPRSV